MSLNVLKNSDLKPSRNYYCDVASVKVSKGNAVKAVCEYFEIKPEEIVTIGDGENDLSMFELTPNSVAMGNSLPEIKRKKLIMLRLQMMKMG